jgi:hypothetical protein
MGPAAFLITVGAALVAVVSTRVQLLPNVIDFTVVLTAAGFGGLTASGIGAGLRFGPDRLGRLTLFGQLVGAVAGLLLLVVGLIAG